MDKNSASLADARDLAKTWRVDILYLDPPYNERDYSGYYHLPETLAIWDKPKIAGLAVYCTKPNLVQIFCSPDRAAEALQQLIQNARAKYILLHYTSKGLVSRTGMCSFLIARTRPYQFDLNGPRL